MTGVLLDEMYPPSLARQLRERGHDVLAALDVEVGLSSRSDEDVPAWATRHERCVVTGNVRDFARLAALSPHAGMILVSARRFPRTRSGLARIATALDAVLAGKRLPAPDAVAWLGSDG
ncbi:DUF5615 family PIN-like protein [Micromonospora sp. NPDC000089]|uniref:DUF5615 family PIN-like protein n=1 Tax=unclassified Micromonospora TaxID=2617518 RepID=UPI003675B6A0